ncbi:M14 family zinc carboxypeptidase [Urechidicola vernalis]|uniref:M14 family zinc carboxypeptidase n=1 Tax=Urechidicola vernalis TaxID=3075600 RepID=A0ABU2Y195_9FLAO|nr:M14 family zinc carboxypeptidase [Urechidicola sp. P050]MDT0551911.1 M14 family zinc carboxypeptidase [Urechidicola sp. P050]
MQALDKSKIEQWYASNFQNKLKGLRILFKDIEPLINDLSNTFKVEKLGDSVRGIPIYKIKIGSGKKRILIWSQMHGNESTGTKAVFDLFNFFGNPEEFDNLKSTILKECTIVFIPMLNPDGAIKYTRENENEIDLNRDAVDLNAIESRLLRKELEDFDPQFCFNLHDQRTIFNVKGTKNPATISFLAPSEEITRKITKGRTETMSVIVSMNNFLQSCIPNHIGRYTDEYYPTATGDNFQKLGYNTILIEAGHFQEDYEREITRKYNFFALIDGLVFLSNNDDYNHYKSYFEIPNNDKKFYDIVYRNAKLVENRMESIVDFGVLFKYKVIDNKLVKYNFSEVIRHGEVHYGHVEIDLENKPFNQM